MWSLLQMQRIRKICDYRHMKHWNFENRIWWQLGDVKSNGPIHVLRETTCPKLLRPYFFLVNYRAISYCELEAAVGFLLFAAKIVVPRRVFLRRLFDAEGFAVLECKDDARYAIKKLSGPPILLRSRYLPTIYKNRPEDTLQLESRHSLKVTI